MIKLSVVIATYTGEKYLPDCIKSLFEQKGSIGFEIVVVIDGPSKSLRKVLEAEQQKYAHLKTKFVVHQFKQNQGRFLARQKGAELASSENILFVDDRITLKNDYFQQVLKHKDSTIISNVVERGDKSAVSSVIRSLRSKIYKNGWDKDFETYEVTEKNFEKTAKGTAGLWINTKSFLQACSNIETDDVKNASDDTKILKLLLGKNKMLKSSEAVIYYEPRTDLVEEIAHTFKRGPRFIDYYLMPGTRFFKYLIALFGVAILTLGLGIMYKEYLPFVVAGVGLLDILVSTWIAKSLKNFIESVFVLPLITSAFLAGILVGVVKKIVRLISSKLSILLTLIFLAIFAWYGFSNRESFSSLQDVTILTLSIIATGAIAMQFAAAIFNKVTVDLFTKKIVYLESLYVSIISSAGNYFGPLLGGTSLRAIYLKKSHKLSYTDFTAILAGYYLIIFTLNSILALVSLAFLPKTSQTNALFIFFAVWLVILLGLMFIKLPSKQRFRFFIRKKLIERLIDKVYEIEKGWRILIKNKKLLVKFFFISLIGPVITFGVTYVEFQAIGVNVTLASLGLYTSFVATSTLLSLTPGGIGIRESLLLIFSTTIGVTNDQILQVAVIDRSVTFFVLVFLFVLIKIPIITKIMVGGKAHL